MHRTPSFATALAVLALAACSETASERPAPATAEAAPVVVAASAVPDTLPRPGSPAVTDPADGVAVTHAVHPSLPPHHFTPLPAAEGGAIRAIRVRAAGAGEAHELPVSESLVPEHFPLAERVMVEDLDFDGYADLGFVTMMGATGNATADYWRFDPATRRFVAVGTHPVFTVDAAGRRLRAHHKGGHAGLLFTDETYRWVDGRPVLVRVETQDSDDAGEGYVRTVQELRDGQFVEVERRVMTREEAVAEMERG